MQANLQRMGGEQLLLMNIFHGCGRRVGMEKELARRALEGPPRRRPAAAGGHVPAKLVA